MTLIQFKGRLDQEVEVHQAINDFQSDTAEIEGKPDPWFSRSTLYIAVAMVVSAIVWASLAQIDKVVTARGKIVSASRNIVVQPLETSIIKTLDVKAGDIVKAGQVLVTLDPTFTGSDLSQLRVRQRSFDAEIARLEAEIEGKPYSANLAEHGEIAVMQETLYRSRQAQHRAQLQSFDERISRAASTIISSQRQRELLTAQINDLKEIESIRKQLLASQVGSKLNALSASANRLSVSTSLAQAIATEESSKHELDDLKAQREAYVQDWRNQLTREQVQKRTERDVVVEQMLKAQKRQDLVTLTAPVDGVILEVANVSQNSIVQPAQALFTLVPTNAPLKVMAAIDGSEIGFVRTGDPVQVKIDAYSFMRHGAAEGVVRLISEDSFTTNRGDVALVSKPDALSNLFYRAEVELTSVKLRNVPENFQLLPGLPVTAEITVGHRSVISYFLRPLLQGLNESMREP